MFRISGVQGSCLLAGLFEFGMDLWILRTPWNGYVEYERIGRKAVGHRRDTHGSLQIVLRSHSLNSSLGAGRLEIYGSRSGLHRQRFLSDPFALPNSVQIRLCAAHAKFCVWRQLQLQMSVRYDRKRSRRDTFQ